MNELLMQVRRVARWATIPDRRVRRVAAVFAFVLLTTLGAYIEAPIPGSAVPVTLQTVFVLLSGVLLGPALGASAQTVYVLLGALGLPVFSGGGLGPAWLLGPTGGYLLAFPLAAAVAGWLAGPTHARSSWQASARLLLALLAGTAVIYAGGASQLALLTGDATRAVTLGVVPFLLGDVLKVVLALIAARRWRNRTLGWL